MIPGLLGAIYFQWAQELWPEESWPSRLGREVFHVASGDTRYTATVLNALDRDPALGPLGSYLAARLLEDRMPSASLRFLRRARKHASTAELKRELTLLLSMKGKGRDVLADLLAQLQSTDLAALEQAATVLGSAFAREARTWREQAAALKDRPPVEAVLPFLIRGWETGGRDSFLAQIDAMLASKEPDPWIVAATVDAHPVSRKLGDVAAALGLPAFVTPWRAKSGDAAEAEFADGVEALIVLRLAQIDFQRRGGKATQELMMEALSDAMREMKPAQQLVGQFSRDDLRLLAEQLLALRTLRREIAASVKPLSDAELDRAMTTTKGAAPVHLRLIRRPGDARAEAELLRGEISKLGFAAVWERERKANEAACSEFENLQPDDLIPALAKLAFSLKPGQTSGLLPTAGNFYFLHIVDPAAAPAQQAAARAKARRRFEATRAQTALAERVAALRAGAEIQLVASPRAVPVAPKAPAATRIEGESLKKWTKHEGMEVNVMEMSKWDAKHWSGATQMWIKGAENGWVEFDLEVPADDTFQLVLHATRAINFARVQVQIDGTDAGPVQEFYAAGVVPSGPRALGAHALTKGTHKLRFNIVGRHPESTGVDLGFDALDLIPAGSQ